MTNTIIICAGLLLLSVLVALGPSFIPGLRSHKLPPGQYPNTPNHRCPVPYLV